MFSGYIHVQRPLYVRILLKVDFNYWVGQTIVERYNCFYYMLFAVSSPWFRAPSSIHISMCVSTFCGSLVVYVHA
jgi:hypothetical protein